MTMKLIDIQNFIEDFTELDITKKTRQRPYVYARSIYFHLARKHTFCGLEKIAESMGAHHTNVLHCLNKVVPHILKHDKKLANLCTNFEQIYFDSLKNSTTRRQDLIAENSKLKSELLKYKQNRLINLIGSIPESQEQYAYDKIEFMIKIMNARKSVKQDR